MEDEKKFDNRAFGYDVLSYRTDCLRMGRREFSEKVGISSHIINAMENGHARPQIDDIYKLSNLMGKKIEDYFN